MGQIHGFLAMANCFVYTNDLLPATIGLEMDVSTEPALKGV
jgi:hypothetical protein